MEPSAKEQIQQQIEFVTAYELKHFGPEPENQEFARSEALNAYYNLLGYKFGSDEDSFILPN